MSAGNRVQKTIISSRIAKAKRDWNGKKKEWRDRQAAPIEIKHYRRHAPVGGRSSIVN